MKAATLLLGIFMLATCTALPRPFQHKNLSTESGLTNIAYGGAIRVEIDHNLPEFIAKHLSRETVEALARVNIPASANPNFASKYFLKGSVKVEQANALDPEEATFVWTIISEGTRKIGVFEQVIQGDQAGWLLSDPGLFAVIAGDAGSQIAAILHADQKLDPIAVGSSDFPREIFNTKNLVPTLFLAEVDGAPGDGNQALLRSLNFLLNREVGNMATNRDKADYLVKGVVNVGRPVKGQCEVAITWLVTSGDGKELGKVTQNNRVPKSSLDGGWGQMAFMVAGGAMLGIKDVINRDFQRRR